jgi:hypothetical protein
MRWLKRWAMRGLALGHVAWGLFLLSLATWVATGVFRVLPHMSTGSVWTNLPAVLVLAFWQAGPLGGLGLWMMALGCWTWAGLPHVRRLLLASHGFLLLPGASGVAVGVHALRAAARSAARGGGLLSPIGFYPLAIGSMILVVALCSMALALTAAPRDRASPGR